MKIKTSVILSAFILAFGILAASCSSTTIISSEPEGAKLYIDEEYVGKTPYSYTDTKILGSQITVRILADGYAPFNTVISRDEKVDAGAIVGGLFFLIPFLWTMEYKPTHFYELTPEVIE